MVQVFRLMGMPDRVIAFDQLPDRLLQGFELCGSDGFPRHWKAWMGKIKKITKIPPEKDFLTGQVRRFDPIVEEESYFYLVDWTLNASMEKWKEVCDFVRQHVSKDVRLMDKIEDMSKPLAANKSDGVTLEPEDVVVIPIPIEYQEIGVGLITPAVAPKRDPLSPKAVFKCTEEGCVKEFSAKQGLVMHKMKKHSPVSVPV
jgi:hypothetical protein